MIVGQYIITHMRQVGTILEVEDAILHVDLGTHGIISIPKYQCKLLSLAELMMFIRTDIINRLEG